MPMRASFAPCHRIASSIFSGLIGRGDGPGGNPVEAFTLLTTAPGPDVAPYHNRQPVILERQDWAAWLDASRPALDLLRPSPAGSLLLAEFSAP